MPSETEENYLKAIFKIGQRTTYPVSTNAIAQELGTSAASVTDMLKRLAEKSYVRYEKYKGAHLTDTGDSVARQLVRKHRLWEVFLVEKLDFSWSEVHDIAEQLEHIQAPTLTERLSDFLGNPKYDPHGDPIPDASGRMEQRHGGLLCDAPVREQVVIVGVREHSNPFLEYLEQQGLVLGTRLTVLERYAYDDSARVTRSDGATLSLSDKVCRQLYVVVEGR